MTRQEIKKWALSGVAAVIGGVGLSTASAETLLLRDPAISADHIAFVYAGDIWVAAKDGASPRRLTSHIASEGGPIFSDDGKTIAYTATYQGNTDVYTIPVAGGQPTRHTFHPGADVAVDWSPSGDAVAFVSRRETLSGRSNQLFHTNVAGGLPEKQMEARIFRGRYNDAGDKIAQLAFGPSLQCTIRRLIRVAGISRRYHAQHPNIRCKRRKLGGNSRRSRQRYRTHVGRRCPLFHL